jgi:hypothetical protein
MRALAVGCIALLAVLASFCALAAAGSALLRPFYRYDARHDVLPDWLWDHGLPWHGHYRSEYGPRRSG